MQLKNEPVTPAVKVDYQFRYDKVVFWEQVQIQQIIVVCGTLRFIEGVY